jgi:hypothetical protein
MADDEERKARQALTDATNGGSERRLRSSDTLRSHMNIPSMNMDLDHEGSSPWDGECALFPLRFDLRKANSSLQTFRRSKSVNRRLKMEKARTRTKQVCIAIFLFGVALASWI